MFGLSIEKLFVIAIIAAIVIGPQRLPRYAEKLAVLVRAIRDFAETARARVAEELGPDFDTDEWKKLDPRQYDPRRIVQDALADGEAASAGTALAAPPPQLATPQSAAPIRGWQGALLSRVTTPSETTPSATDTGHASRQAQR